MNGNGFTAMQHTITEAIMLRDFTKRQRKILDLILRLSWGCQLPDAIIPHQRDFSAVGIYEADIGAELKWLEASKVIFREDARYWFNDNFEDWKVSFVKPYQPEKLSELLSFNLKRLSKTLSNDGAELSETLSENLVKHQVSTLQNTKFPTRNLASPKETLNKLKENNNTELIKAWGR